ncbi:hypothetical protein PGIGA_G00260300 [Pangasianodon gigas]|uniref:Uncharacterized protein n=1 Tax=Pangasianodon gigas TaxID=30993 RepID=A0ACC5WT02_PANGG|nr:hypothetical protein [Pangasianodon gigas]
MRNPIVPSPTCEGKRLKSLTREVRQPLLFNSDPPLSPGPGPGLTVTARLGMGKEQELLEAARTGNVLLVEKLLSGKRGLLGSGSGSIALPGLLRYSNKACKFVALSLCMCLGKDSGLKLALVPRMAILGI